MSTPRHIQQIEKPSYLLESFTKDLCVSSLKIKFTRCNHGRGYPGKNLIRNQTRIKHWVVCSGLLLIVSGKEFKGASIVVYEGLFKSPTLVYRNASLLIREHWALQDLELDVVLLVGLREDIDGTLSYPASTTFTFSNNLGIVYTIFLSILVHMSNGLSHVLLAPSWVCHRCISKIYTETHALIIMCILNH